jgi:hypothetical protein
VKAKEKSGDRRTRLFFSGIEQEVIEKEVTIK